MFQIKYNLVSWDIPTGLCTQYDSYDGHLNLSQRKV